MPKRLLKWMNDPPEWRPVWALEYSVSAMVGVATLIAPPRTIESQLGQVLTLFWGAVILVGGVLGLSVVFSRHWWVERIAIHTVWLGLAVYCGMVGWLALTTSGNRWTQLGVILLAMVALLPRRLMIKGFDTKPPVSEPPGVILNTLEE